MLNLRMVESVIKMFTTIVSEVVLTCRDLGGELLGFAIVPGTVWKEILFVKGIGLVVGKLVVAHINKFITRDQL